jgi:hypothetical protein
MSAKPNHPGLDALKRANVKLLHYVQANATKSHERDHTANVFLRTDGRHAFGACRAGQHILLFGAYMSSIENQSERAQVDWAGIKTDSATNNRGSGSGAECLIGEVIQNPQRWANEFRNATSFCLKDLITMRRGGSSIASVADLVREATAGVVVTRKARMST